MHLNVDSNVVIPVNVFPLTDDTDYKTREPGVAWNDPGMDLVWNFLTVAGVATQTAIVPTSGGEYDWSHLGDAMYAIELPASGGLSVNNDQEGYGWITGVASGVLPWRGPIICFRPAELNAALVTGASPLDANLVEVNGLPVSTGQINLNVVNRSSFQNGTLTIIRSADYQSPNTNLVHFTDVANIDSATDLVLTIVNTQTQSPIFTRKAATAFSEVARTADFSVTAAELAVPSGTQYAFAVERKKTVTLVDYFNPILLGPCTIRDNNRTF